jgi:uncharacterized protein (TIRG00374 family)
MLIMLTKYHIPFWRGCLAYISGFAFTATPGKVGELVRIRYFNRLHVHPSTVIAAFIFERSIDLTVVLIIGSIWAFNTKILFLAISTVLFFIFFVGLFIYKPKFLILIQDYLIKKDFKRISTIINYFVIAISDCRKWLTVRVIFLSYLLGFFAWGLISIAFVFLLFILELNIPIYRSLSIYPLSMLVGAASMIPGGFGSTEAAIVIQLQWLDVPIEKALLAAVTIRLATIWFSVFSGFVAILIQEFRNSKY